MCVYGFFFYNRNIMYNIIDTLSLFAFTFPKQVL